MSYPAGLSGSIAALLLIILMLFMRSKTLESTSALEVSSLFLVVLFFTNLFRSHYNLIPFERVTSEVSALFLLLIALSRLKRLPYYITAILAPVLLLHTLIDTCGNQILFSDDHATFLYRLIMLKENFPHIPFYNPLWNAGIDERYFFATGTLNIFFLLAPFIYSLDLWQYYTLIPALILFVIVPGASYLGTRLTSGSRQAAAISAMLALSSSLGWYHWSLHYGPLGFLTTAALTPLLAALVARVLYVQHSLHPWEVLATIIVGTLVLLWSPGGIIFLPALLIGIFHCRSLLKKRYVKLILSSLFIINLPWVLVFWSASNVSNFLVKSEDIRKVQIVTEKTVQKNSPELLSQKHMPLTERIQKHLDLSTKLLNRNLQTANPIILLLAIPALFFFPAPYRILYAAMALWLLALGSIIAPLKAQLELDRMLIVLCLFLSVPIGHSIAYYITENRKRLTGRIISSFLFAFIIIGLISTAGIIRKRTAIRYTTASPMVHSLANALELFKDDGRVLFTGFVLHELEGGHLAPLTTLTKTPLIASSQVHNHWKYKDVIPSEFLGQGAEKIETYYDLLNVTALVTTDRTWRGYLESLPELYTRVWKERNFYIFKRKNHINNYFLKGRGSILEQSSNSVTLTLETTDATIKYRYFPFLKSSGCTISPAAIAEETTFITLNNCPINQPIVIESKPAYVRINS